MFSILAQVDTSGLPKPTPDQHTISTVLGVVFAITASIALLMMVIAGFRYVIAGGDPQAMARAKNTIIYALVGLLVSLAAFSIVTFVIKGIS